MLAVNGSLQDFKELAAGTGSAANQAVAALCDKHQAVLLWSAWLSCSALISLERELQSVEGRTRALAEQQRLMRQDVDQIKEQQRLMRQDSDRIDEQQRLMRQDVDQIKEQLQTQGSASRARGWSRPRTSQMNQTMQPLKQPRKPPRRRQP